MNRVDFRRFQLDIKRLKLFLCWNKEENESSYTLTNMTIFCVRMWHAGKFKDTLVSTLMNLILSVL